MTSPVNNSPISSHFPRFEEEKEEIKETNDSGLLVESSVEVKTQKEKLESDFQRLIKDYNHSIQFTEGTGTRGQYYIDNEWKKLQDFVEQNPEFQERMPKTKYVSRDDGTGGMSTALATMFADMHRNGDDCRTQ